MTRSDRVYLTMGVAAMMIAVDALGAQRVDVRGTISDSATKQPVNGALLTISDGTQHYTARTDEAGAFFIYGVQASSYRTLIRRIGYTAVESSLEVVPGMKPTAIAMAPLPQALREVRVRGEGAGIFGQIGNASTLGVVPGATIQVAGADKGVVTDSSGTYFVPLQKAGNYVVRVSAEGFAEEMYIISVKRNQVADGSRLISEGEGRHVPEVLWKDFDQRVRWSTVNGNALLAGSEVREAGASIRGALEMSGTMVAKSLRLGSQDVCVYVNGRPAPGFAIDAIRPEEVTAIEAYGSGISAKFLADGWPRGAMCSETGLRKAGTLRWLVIWTR